VLDGKSVHKKGFCLCHSFFNNILHFCTFSEKDAQAFLDLYTNLMKNSQMVAFFVQILDFCAKQKGSLTLFHEHLVSPATIVAPLEGHIPA
jgi:hypothetical protein